MVAKRHPKSRLHARVGIHTRESHLHAPHLLGEHPYHCLLEDIEHRDEDRVPEDAALPRVTELDFEYNPKPKTPNNACSSEAMFDTPGRILHRFCPNNYPESLP